MTTSVSTPAAHETRTPSARIGYLDAARAVAIVGMVLAPIAAFVELPAPIENLVSGRSAIMFAILAGVSTTLIARSGAVTDRERLGYTNASSSRNLLVRAGILLLIGLTLPLISAGPTIILSTYAVLYLLAIPVLRLSTRAIAILAAVTAFATPLLSFWLRTTWPDTGEEIIIGGVPTVLSFTSVEGTVQAFRQLLIDGMYPVLTWIPFLLAGIIIGRLILNSRFTARVSATAGALLALIGYGTSWALVHFTDFMSQRIAVYRQFDPSLANASDEELMDQFGTIAYTNFGVTDTNDARSLLLAAHHSGSITEIIGGIGFTLLVLTVLALFERFAAPVLAPFKTLGKMPLTYYVAHVIGFLVLILTATTAPSLGMCLVSFIIIPMVFAAAWFHFFRRGPLEAVLHAAARRASTPRQAKLETQAK